MTPQRLVTHASLLLQPCGFDAGQQLCLANILSASGGVSPLVSMVQAADTGK
jgi:hypothetical protein